MEAQALLFDLPHDETRSDWKQLREFMSIALAEGNLINVSTAARLLGLSNQRVYVFLQEGTLKSWEFFGKTWVSAQEVLSFSKLQRDPGAPAGKMSIKEFWRASMDDGEAIGALLKK